MKNDNEQTTPVVSLDDIMEDALEVFEGELNAQAAPKTEPGQPSSTDTGKPGPAGEESLHEQPSKTAKAPDEHPDTAPQKTANKDVQPPAKPPEKKPSFRFVSHEEAEKGYKNLQGEKTKIEADLKAERERREALERSEAEKTRVLELEKDVVSYSTTVNRDALKRINELDPDAEDYTDKVAEIQAEAYRDIRRYEREKEETGRDGNHAPGQKKAGEDDLAAARRHVREVAEENEIDPDDDYFGMVCARAPVTGENGTPMSFDEQIAWAVEKTKHYQASITGRAGGDGDEKARQDAAERKARERQEQNLVLGRTASARRDPEKEESRPVTLNDAIESAMEERRL